MKEGEGDIRGPLATTAQARKVGPGLAQGSSLQGLHVPPSLSSTSEAWGFGHPPPRSPAPPGARWQSHSSLQSQVFDIQIKVELVWENSVPQKPVMGACGNINTRGELMGSFVAAFKEKSWEFHSLRSGPSQIPLPSVCVLICSFCKDSRHVGLRRPT